MRCPSCGQDDSVTVETTCPDPDEPGDVLRFEVCRNCDYGINEHTEGECSCPRQGDISTCLRCERPVIWTGDFWGSDEPDMPHVCRRAPDGGPHEVLGEVSSHA
jgi:hypothetical protein